MKKFIPIIAIALIGASLTSCKKEYTCECKANGVVIGTTTIKDTKKKAKDACNNSSSVPGMTVTCEIK